MDSERHVEIDETHEEPEAQPATEATEAAAAAVALAGASAAAAELDAAERMRRFELESQEWRTNLSQNVNSLTQNLQTLREEELSSLKNGQTELSAVVLGLAGKLDGLESKLSNPPPSMPPEPEPEPATLAGAEIQAGPLEAESSIGLSEEPQTTSERAHPVRRRRWI